MLQRPRKDAQTHGNGDHVADYHAFGKGPVHHAMISRTRLSSHHIRINRIGGKAECGKSVGDQIDPKKVNRQQGCWKTDEDASGHEQQLGGVAGKQVL